MKSKEKELLSVLLPFQPLVVELLYKAYKKKGIRLFNFLIDLFKNQEWQTMIHSGKMVCFMMYCDIIFILCVSVCLRVCLHYVSTWCLQRPEEGMGSLGSGVTGGCELGIKPRSFAKATNVLIHCTISPAPPLCCFRQRLSLHWSPTNGQAVLHTWNQSECHPCLGLIWLYRSNSGSHGFIEYFSN